MSEWDVRISHADFGTQISGVVGEKKDGIWVIRHVTRVPIIGGNEPAAVAGALRNLADWLTDKGGYERWMLER